MPPVSTDLVLGSFRCSNRVISFLHICFTVLTFVRPHWVTLFSLGTLFERRHLYNFEEKQLHKGALALYNHSHSPHRSEYNFTCLSSSCTCICASTCEFSVNAFSTSCMLETTWQDLDVDGCVAHAHIGYCIHMHACMHSRNY